jgi:hypothetical protein
LSENSAFENFQTGSIQTDLPATTVSKNNATTGTSTTHKTLKVIYLQPTDGEAWGGVGNPAQAPGTEHA